MNAAEALAKQFHETYERLAPAFNYDTRKESAKPWIQVPDTNKKLMIAVCAEILDTYVKAAIEKATEPKDEALLRIFEWASRNAPYPECKIEGNTLLQDICEQGLGYWPPSRAARASEQE